MNILTAEQIRKLDKFTIEHLPISSIDLMERAARACFDWFIQNIDLKHFTYIFCGPGNNGGDGLALARMLKVYGYKVKAIVLNAEGRLSEDSKTNLERLKSIDKHIVDVVTTAPASISFPENTVIVDALFGTGLSRITDAATAELIRLMNGSGLQIISIDLPSGIYSDKTSLLSGNEIVKASTTLTFQYFKTSLLVAENAPYFGKVVILDIGLLEDATAQMDIRKFLTDLSMIRSIYKPKKSYSHKGNFGHALLFAGGPGKMGAAVLAAGGYLKSGGGLLTLLVPEADACIVQTAVPEAMALFYHSESLSPSTLPHISQTVIGAGPGIGMGEKAKSILDHLLKEHSGVLVLDADALNILANHQNWLERLPAETILTPHPGEFRRLAGEWSNDFEKLELQLAFSMKYQVYLILKGKNSTIACPDGSLYFNPTGNPGMAKGGSGDILTGLLTGLVASGYSPLEACILGVYLHGFAGDVAAARLTEEGMNAGDIIHSLPEAWKHVSGKHTQPS